MKRQKEEKKKQKSPKHSFPCEVSPRLENLISQRASVPQLSISSPGEQRVNRQELLTCIQSAMTPEAANRGHSKFRLGSTTETVNHHKQYSVRRCVRSGAGQHLVSGPLNPQTVLIFIFILTQREHCTFACHDPFYRSDGFQGNSSQEFTMPCLLSPKQALNVFPTGRTRGQIPQERAQM